MKCRNKYCDQVFFLPVSSSDGATQHRLVGPDVGGPAAPAGGGRSGGGGGRHRAQHAAAETQEQHLVSRLGRDGLTSGSINDIHPLKRLLQLKLRLQPHKRYGVLAAYQSGYLSVLKRADVRVHMPE